ncbi:MAG: lytic transglycosylase domain-containing protein [Vicinamibacteria bacterium]
MLRNAALLAGLALVGAIPASADTLFLKSGKTLKIEALSCGASACTAALPGGQAEIRAADVLRVEPDEVVEPKRSISPAVPPLGRDADPRTIEGMVRDAARKYALPRSLVRAVARAESALDPAAISPKGAMGVMQLMPHTATQLGVRDAFDPAENIDAGARLLRQLLERYDGRVAEALAAYNAGSGAVAKHKGVPPFRETRGYIRKVVKDFERPEGTTAAESAGKKP